MLTEMWDRYRTMNGHPSTKDFVYWNSLVINFQPKIIKSRYAIPNENLNRVSKNGSDICREFVFDTYLKNECVCVFARSMCGLWYYVHVWVAPS